MFSSPKFVPEYMVTEMYVGASSPAESLAEPYIKEEAMNSVIVEQDLQQVPTKEEHQSKLLSVLYTLGTLMDFV
jgi:hypothetical protein